MQSLLINAVVFTGLKDIPEKDWAVLIEDDRIKAVGLQNELIQAYPDTQVVDLSGKFLMPGLVDTHRHMIGYTEAQATVDVIATGAVEGVIVAYNSLRCGITSVRDPGCKHFGILTLKNLVNQGLILGPHIYAAGPNPTGAAAPESWRNMWVDGETEIRHAVRELKRHGVDWIKFVVSCQSREQLWSRTDKFLTLEELKAGVKEAHQYGYRVSGHVEGLDGAQAAVEAGFTAIEHGTVVDAALAKKMADTGVFYVPTLFAFDSMSVQEKPLLPHEEIAFRSRADEHKRSFQRAFQAGVKIAVGTDMYRIPPHDAIVNEMKMLVKYGMTNAQVLKAATVVGAELIGEQDNFGAIAPGMRADLIAINGNPLADLDVLLDVLLVFKSGELVDFSEKL